MFLLMTPLVIDRNQKTIFFYVHKRSITGEPRAVVRVQVPRVVVQVNRPRPSIRATIPVAANIDYPLQKIIPRNSR